MINPKPTLSLQKIHERVLELSVLHSLIYSDMDFVFRNAVKDTYKEFFFIKKLGDEIAKIPRWRYENHLMSRRVFYSFIASYIMRGLMVRGLSAGDSVDAMIVGLWRMPFTYEGAKRLWKSEFVS